MEQSELVVTLLFLAWHVRMESRSDLSSLSNVKTFSTFNWDGLTKVSSMMVCTPALSLWRDQRLFYSDRYVVTANASFYTTSYMHLLPSPPTPLRMLTLVSSWHSMLTLTLW